LIDIIYVLFNISGHGMLNILIGSIAAILLVKYPIYFKFNIKHIILLQIALLCISWFFYSYKLPFSTNQIFCSVSIATLIIASIVNKTGVIFKFLNYKPVRYLGTLSYSLYIWQQIFTYKQPWANSFSHGDSILLNLVFLAITAVISYHFYEKAFLKLKQRFTKN
ncbi:acyltransferase family protein, partial [Mucilaginibacter sp.]